LINGKKRTINAIDKVVMRNLESPVTTNSVDARLLNQRNVSSLGDAFKSVTGVRPINRYGGFQTFRIRGFSNFVLLVDGVRDERHNLSNSAPSTNLANIERIEVLKGPASVLLGHSALGGVINLVKKKPSFVTKASFKATYGSYNSVNMSGGIGGPITDKLRYRVDVGTTRTEGWRAFGEKTTNGAVTLDYDLTDKDYFQFSFQANNDIYDTDTGIPMLENSKVVPGMDIETRYNDPQDYLKHKRKDFQLRYIHTFSDLLKITAQMSWSDDDIDYMSTEFLELSKDQKTIKRAYPYYFNHHTGTFQNQLDLSYKFNTGRIKHRSVIGHSLSVLDRKTYGGAVEGPGTFTTISVSNPILNQGHIEAVDSKVSAREEVVNGFYIQDWMALSKKIKLLVGLRYDVFSGTYYKDKLAPNRKVLEEGVKTKIPTTAVTYRAGLVYEAMDNLSLFTSYSNYFKPTRRITPEGQVFDPEKGYQLEAGIKLEEEHRYSITLSAFYLQKNNIVERNKVKEYHQIGEADSKGIELDIAFEIFDGCYFKGGYAFVDAKVREFDSATLQAIQVGNKLKFTPEHLVNAWLNYEKQEGLAKGLGLGLGFNYVSENYTNSSNTYLLPSYATVDATVYHQFKTVRLSLNVDNITDKLYFADAIYGNQFFPGKGRNYKLSLGYKF
ncbi:MAG: TonB-dependent siderophore receptor, partial [Flavobacteriaceae bacterium]